MRYIITSVVVSAALFGCTTQPTHITEYVTQQGERWLIATKSGGSFGASHLSINGERIASAFAADEAGGSASGSGVYHGQVFSFNCAPQRTPNCFVYAGGELVSARVVR